MNQAIKAKWANILTAIVSVVTVLQSTFLTNPPFSEQMIFTLGTVFTFVVLSGTAWKQYLSPDVSQTAVTVTVWYAVIATAVGIADLLGAFNLSPQAVQYIKWGISVLATILNITSKQLFPSDKQKDTMASLKYQR